MRRRRLWLILPFLIFCGIFAVYYTGYRQGRDTTAPVLNCETDRITASIHVTEEELLEGVTAEDNVDGDLTSKILIEDISRFSGDVRIICYAVVDSSNNIGRMTRELVYEDYESPKFSLKEPLIFNLGETYDLLGIVEAYDVLDGDITKKVRLTADNSEYMTPGVFEVSYGVSNSAGDYVTVTLNMEIVEADKNNPVIILTEPLIYLKQGEAFSPLDYVESVIDPKLNYGLSAEEYAESYDISAVEVTNPVDTSVPGTYEVTYKAHSAVAGYIGSTRLIVIVEED